MKNHGVYNKNSIVWLKHFIRFTSAKLQGSSDKLYIGLNNKLDGSGDKLQGLADKNHSSGDNLHGLDEKFHG